jgi:hypothetical protein
VRRTLPIEELIAIYYPPIIAHAKTLILLKARAPEIVAKTGLPPRVIEYLRGRLSPKPIPAAPEVADPNDDVLTVEEVRQIEHHTPKRRVNKTKHGRAERARRRAQAKRVAELLKTAGIRPLSKVARDPDPPPHSLLEPEKPFGSWREQRLFPKRPRHTGGPDTGTDPVPTAPADDDDDLTIISALTGNSRHE